MWRMHEAVSDILIARARQGDDMNRALMVSLLLHATLLTVIAFAPRDWLNTSARPESNPLIINLGPAVGPDSGGMTSISARPVQAAEPEAKTPTPPAAKQPETIDPEPSKPIARTAKPVAKPVDKSTARKPTTGPEVKTGAAATDIPFGAATPVPGLSTGGAGDGSAYTDYANFCCPAYLQTLVQLIRRNWNQNQGSAGMVLMKFSILRDGRIVDVEHEKKSGQFLLDQEAQRAVSKTILPPLPREFPEERLTVHLFFNYKR
jgi:TonB family protein